MVVTMQKSAAIITDEGGMTAHAAIPKLSSRTTPALSRGRSGIQKIDSGYFAQQWQNSGMTRKISPWLTGITRLSLPIAHGEGKFYADSSTLAIMKKQSQIAGKYYKGEISTAQNLKPNPNGSMLDIAMITSPNGKILGAMPHPERAIFFTQAPDWTLQKEKMIRQGKVIPKFGPSLQIFKNAINYFK